jgi:tetratricopeptide (TPR) repeat protein
VGGAARPPREEIDMDRFCDDAAWIAAYLDRTMDAAERARCEEHLAACARCRAELVAIEAELGEMGLGRAARAAFARRAVRGGRRGPAIASLVSGAFDAMRARGRMASAAAAVLCVAIALVAGVLVVQRFVPSRDPDLRRGRADLAAVIAAADMGDMRIAGGPAQAAEGPRFRGPGTPGGAGAPGKETFDRAEVSLQKALLRRPESVEAHRMLGDLYLAGAQPERAANAYRRALLRRPDDPVLLNNLAVALYRSGDIEASRETLERALDRVDAPAEICYNLAVTWRESGDRARMERYLELYLAKDGDSPWADKARRMLSE